MADGPKSGAPKRHAPWPAARTWLWRTAATAAVVVTAYFRLPFDRLGTRHPGLAWLLFALVLAGVAVLLLRQVRHVLTGRPGTRPGLAITLLIILTAHTFAACYYILSRQPGEFSGLRTRVDALYFTVVTFATVGYGDVTPRGQASRVVTVVQILYTFVFLTAAATALAQRARDLVLRRPDDPAP
ncbi:potassium channel family protein [Streptomyces sp. CRN 30]|uniref:potassium channel family protein n=1 Tax=Streptomyces sp. CRN 30 TaxID=3075613 RepID=UPI002A83908C|nr:potassium channel family protein [Streptomyces sp. CRN 30]